MANWRCWIYLGSMLAVASSDYLPELDFYVEVQAQMYDAEFAFDVTVEPKRDSICVINLGDDNCSTVIEEDDLLVEYTATRYGLARGFHYTKPGVYEINLVCERNGTITKKTSFAWAAAPLSGLKLIPEHNSSIELKLDGGLVHGTINFTFTDGMVLSGIYQTDEGIRGIPKIDETSKRGYVDFSSGSFITFGSHNIDITLFNLLNNTNEYYKDVVYENNSTISVTVVYEERIKGLVFFSPDTVLVNSEVNMVGTIAAGSNVEYMWSFSPDTSTCLQIAVCPSVTYTFVDIGMNEISLNASNTLDQAHFNKTVWVVRPIQGFSLAVTPEQPAELIIHAPGDSFYPMGSLSYEISSTHAANTSKTSLHISPGTNQAILENLPTENTTFLVRIFNEISEQNLTINSMILSRPVPDFTVNSKSFILIPDGQAVFILSLNSSSKPDDFACTINFGDSHNSTERQSEGLFSSPLIYQYKTPGLYNATFTCSNMAAVTKQRHFLVEVKRFTASDFRFSYDDVVAKNASETNVEVLISIDLFGVLLPPSGVTLQWNLGDGSGVDSHILVGWTKLHVYYIRGSFNMSVVITTKFGSTETVKLPIKIGILDFQSSLAQGIATRDDFMLSVYGAFGRIVHYSLTYGDGSEDEFELSNITASQALITEKIYNISGIYRPHVLAWSERFVEEIPLSHNITVCESFTDIRLEIETEISFPPGTGHLRIIAGQQVSSLCQDYINITCEISYDDGTPVETFIAMLRDESPVRISHTFATVGKLKINANCTGDKVADLHLENTTLVVSSCYGSSIPFLNVDNPIKKFVSEELVLAAKPDIRCLNLTPEFLWKVEKGAMIHSIDQSNTTLLVIKARTMTPGTYKITFYTNFKEYPTIFNSDQVFLVYSRTALQTRIKGGSVRTVGLRNPLILDALSNSFDPDAEREGNQDLHFSWSCAKYGNSDAAYAAIGNMIPNCCTCNELHLPHDGLLVLTPGCLQLHKWYIFHVNVSKDARSAVNYQIIYIVGKPIQMDLRCKVNCLDKVNAEFSLSLESECLDCIRSDRETATYRWKLYKSDTFKTQKREQISFAAITSTGVVGSTMSIRPNTLTPGIYYLLDLEVRGISNRSVEVMAYSFMVNYPPYNGTCALSPEEGIAVFDRFQVECTGWVDEAYNLKRSGIDNGEFLTYQFILWVKNESSLLFSGGSRMTTWQELNVGDEDNDYEVKITARIFDRHKGMAEVNLTGHVLTPLPVMSVVSNVSQIDSILAGFKVRMAESVVTGDVHVVSRTAESASSVLNSLVLPNDPSPLPDNPDSWLQERPPDLPTGDGIASSWDELWKDLKTDSTDEVHQQVKNETKSYIQQVSSVVNASDAQSLNSARMVSSALKTLLSKPDNTDEESLSSAVDSMESVGEQLQSVVTEDMSDTQVGEVINAVFEAVGKTMTAMLKEEGTTDDDKDITTKNTREAIQKGKSYTDKNTLQAIDEAKKKADIHDDERIFFMKRTNMKQKYKFKKQQEMAEQKMPSLLRTVDRALDAASVFLVEGQESAHFTGNNISSRVEKSSLERVLQRETNIDDVELHMQVDSELDLDGTQPVIFKSTVYRKNPYIWESFGRARFLTSPTVLVNLSFPQDKLSDVLVKLNSSSRYSLSIPNIPPAKPLTVVPVYIPLDHDQLLYHRLELKSVQDNVLFYIHPSVEDIQYDVYFRAGQFPTSDLHDYHTLVQFHNDMPGRRGVAKCPAGVLPANGTIYVGIKPTILESQQMTRDGTRSSRHILADISESRGNMTQLLHQPFNVSIAVVGCQGWEEHFDLWDVAICSLGDDSTESETKCICDQISLSPLAIGTTFYVPANSIDFSTVFTQIDVLNNSAVFALVCSLLALYCILSIWARRKDSTDILKWGVTPLIDNLSQDRYLYIVTVYTGMRPGAGTGSRVGFVVAGDKSDTGIRVLSDGIRKNIERQSVTHFLMAVPACLGELQYTRIWHDNSGKGSMASWFVHKVVIEDVTLERKFTFHCGRWLRIDDDDGMIHRILPVSGKENMVAFSKLLYNNARKEVSDSHLWFSVLLRPQRSHFTRLQRLSCCMSFLFLTMISNAMFFQSEQNIVRPTAIHLGFLRFSLNQLYVSVIGILIVTPVNFIVIWFFNKSRPSLSLLQATKEANCACLFACVQPQVKEDRDKLINALIAKGLHNPKGMFLPHYCIYIAWSLLLLCVTTSGFFLFLFSQQWGKAKSEEWLTTFFMSFIESFLILDPVKVIFIAVCFAIFIRKPDESATDGLGAEIKTSKATQKVNNDRGMQFEKVEPLSEDVVKDARMAKLKEGKAIEVMKEIILYLLLLLILYTIGFANRDPRSFMLKNNIYNMMVKPQSDKRFGLRNVVTHEDLVKWLNTTALSALFAEQYYNGSRRHWRDRYYMRDLQNFRVGPPRLRQVRGAKLTNCSFESLYPAPCNTEYSLSNGEFGDFCIGWKSPPCPDTEQVDKFTSAAWTWTPGKDIWGSPVTGRYNTYSGGGYIAELDVNLDVSVVIINELVTERWIDRQTRALSLEFNLYNANVNVFCFVSLMVEFPETGGLMTRPTVLPFRVYHHIGALGSYVLLNEIVYVIFLIVAIINFALNVHQRGFRYMDERWHILDFLSIVASVVGISMYGVREVMTTSAMQLLHEDPKTFINFQHITIWDEILVELIGIVNSIVTVRSMKILGYSKRMNSITLVLYTAGKDLLAFSIIFFIVFLGFVVLGYMLFGQSLEAYHTLLMTFATLMTSMIGKTPFDEMRRNEPLLAQFYFVMFVFFVVLVLLTMFQAIMNESIASVRAQEGIDSSQHEMILLLVRKAQDALSLFMPGLKSKQENKGAETDNDEISDGKESSKKDSDFVKKVFTDQSCPNMILNENKIVNPDWYSRRRPTQQKISQWRDRTGIS